jgi:hypothetical protein
VMFTPDTSSMSIGQYIYNTFVVFAKHAVVSYERVDVFVTLKNTFTTLSFVIYLVLVN